MYNLIAYSNNYSQTTGSLWQYCSEEPFLDAKGTVANFPGGNNSASCKLKKKKKKKKKKRKSVEQKTMVQIMLKLWYH